MSNIFFNIDFKIDVESETILTSFILTMVQNQYLMSIKIDVEFYFCSGGENECLPQNNSHHHSLIFLPCGLSFSLSWSRFGKIELLKLFCLKKFQALVESSIMDPLRRTKWRQAWKECCRFDAKDGGR